MAISRVVAFSSALILAAAIGVLPIQDAGAQPPTTTVTIPTNNYTVSGTSQLLDAVASPLASQVQYEVTGGTLTNQIIATAIPTYYGWLAQWNTTTVANGTYSLQSVASFSGGSSVTSASVTITVNNPPPSTTVVFPDGRHYIQHHDFDQLLRRRRLAGCDSGPIHPFGRGGGSEVFTATPTIFGWIAVLPESAEQPGGCGPITLPVSIESEASYSGGVTGTSAPVNISLIVWVPAGHDASKRPGFGSPDRRFCAGHEAEVMAGLADTPSPRQLVSVPLARPDLRPAPRTSTARPTSRAPCSARTGRPGSRRPSASTGPPGRRGREPPCRPCRGGQRHQRSRTRS